MHKQCKNRAEEKEREREFQVVKQERPEDRERVWSSCLDLFHNLL